nr:carboxypeptidase regulatory-like domain-containing protein [Micromonospora sp. DSM 115978]
MTTHRRAWIQRAGVVVALAASALLAPLAQPASAEDPTVQITELSNGTLRSGERATLRFTVLNNNLILTPFRISVETFDGLSCSGNCDIPANPINPGETVTFTATLTAGNLGAGQSRNGQVRVSAEAGGDEASDARNMTVRGPEQQQVQTVAEVSGKVTDEATGEPVAGAAVALLDAQRRSFNTETNSSGNYRFTGSADRPIAPGSLELGAKKGEIVKTLTINASAGQRITNQRIVLALQAEPTATPSATPEATEEAAVDESIAATEPAQDVAQTASEDSGTGLGSWLLILVGGLLVALGVGAIVLLWMRRKENENEDEPDGAVAGGGRPRTATPGSQGVYHGAEDPTRITSRAGADATMMHSPGLADAPTMMHSRPLVDDEFPDPYGAPLPPQPAGPQAPGYGGPPPPAGRYGAGQQGWDDGDGFGRAGPPTQPGYGAAPAGGYGNAPSSGGGYGNAPSSGSGYGNAPSSGSGYGNAPSSGSGYGGPGGRAGGGYGDAPSSGGGYGGPSAGGGYGGGRDEPYAGERGYGGPAGGSDYPGGGSGGGYGGAGDRYDEPTGRYNGRGGGDYPPPAGPPAADPYESTSYGPSAGRGRGAEQPPYPPEPTRYDQEPAYGGGQGGYDAPGGRGGYDGPSAGGGYDGGQRGGYESGGGYGDSGGGYGQQSGGYGGDGYDQAGSGYNQSGAGGGYEPRRGYDDQAGGYDRPPAPRADGYDDRGYGSDQQGGYYDEGQGGRSRSGPPPQQPTSRSERRSLDWLDD